MELPLEGGTFGFHTFSQKAAFSDISLLPLQDYEPT